MKRFEKGSCGEDIYNTDTTNPDRVVVDTDIHDPLVDVYDPDGNLIVTTDSDLVFNDIRIQILRKKLTGYTVAMHGSSEKHVIDTDGRVENWPADMFDTSVRQHALIIREGALNYDREKGGYNYTC